MVHSGRVRSFDELDRYLGGTCRVNLLDRRYLKVSNEGIVAEIKGYTKGILKDTLDKRRNPRGLIDRVLNGIGYRHTMIAKHGVLMAASRRRLDKENPNSLISAIEERMSSEVKELIERLHFPGEVYWPWMSIFSHPSRKVGACHPWITRSYKVLGEDAVRAAKRVRGLMDLYRSAALKWIEDRLGRETVEKLKILIDRLQGIHFWSERDGLEEGDLVLTNMVVDNFYLHWNEHRTLQEVRRYPNARKYLEPGRLRKAKLAVYILLDDYLSQGRRLRQLIRRKAHG